MSNIKTKISDISKHLQTLTNPEYSEQVQQAVEKQDKNLLISVCNRAKIPSAYTGNVVSIAMSVKPLKWPEMY